MSKYLLNLLFIFNFTMSSMAQNEDFTFTSQDERLIEEHILDFNAYKQKPVPVAELVAEINFLKGLDPAELTRSEHWFIQVFELYQVDPVNKRIRKKQNFEDLKAALNNNPYQDNTTYTFEDIFVFEAGGFENATTIDFTRPYTKNCASIPNSDKRNECTQKRIQFAIKQHFQTNKAIDVFRENYDQVFVRDYEITIYTSLKVNKKGKLEIKNISSIDDDLNKLARRAIKRFPRFEPAKLNGEPIEARFNLPIVFTIYADE
ncbi:MAG: energy transducer TonB [Flavobacteriaceae bacterium]|nr:energy transducer TonB [Flavobacteriaceae bacterium]